MTYDIAVLISLIRIDSFLVLAAKNVGENFTHVQRAPKHHYKLSNQPIVWRIYIVDVRASRCHRRLMNIF